MTTENTAAIAASESVSKIDAIVDAAVAESAKTPEPTSEPVASPESTPAPEPESPEEAAKAREKTLENAIRYRDRKFRKTQYAIEDLRREVAQLKARSPEAAPDIKNFEGKTHEELVVATAKHAADEAIREDKTKSAEAQLATAEKAWMDERTEILAENVVDARKSLPDFDKTMADYQSKIDGLPKELHPVILDNDHASHAIFSIIKDGLFDEFSSLSPNRAAAMLARHEDKALALSKIKKTTSAPEPMTSVKGSAAAGKSLESMSGQEIRTWMRAQ